MTPATIAEIPQAIPSDLVSIQPRHEIVHSREDAGHDITENVSDRAKYAEGNRRADQKEDHGLKESLEHVGRYLVGKVLRPAHDGSHEKDGKDGRCVAGGDNRNESENIRVGHAEDHTHRCSLDSSAEQVDDIRVAEHCADDHEQRYCVVSLLGNLHSQEDRQEIEEAVRHAVQENVGRARAAHQTEGGQKRQQNLYHTCSKHCRQERCHTACDKSHQSLRDIALRLRRSRVSGLGEVPHLLEFFEEVGYLVSDDDLILAALLDHGLDALDLVDFGVIRLALVVEDQTKTRHAMCCGCDVVGAADCLDDLFRGGYIIQCHIFPLSFMAAVLSRHPLM